MWLIFWAAVVTSVLINTQAKPTEIVNVKNPRAGRALAPSMEMLDPKRHPKPKRPMGNDIGMARIRSLADVIDHVETTVSIGYTMSTGNNTQAANNEETAAVSREMHDIVESVPSIPYQPVGNLTYHRDPEQESLNQRITEVARQLTETALRKQYEQGQFRHVFPIPADILRKIDLPVDQTTTEELMTEVLIQTTDASETMTTEQLETTVKPTIASEKIFIKLPKIGKSLDMSKAQPLVSHVQQEAPQLQLIEEIQSVPRFIINDGYSNSPQQVEPLLGGITIHRMPKAMIAPRPGLEALSLPNFLKIVSPRYKFSPNDLVVSVPVGGGAYMPAIVSGKNTWWTDPAYKEIVESKSQSN